MTFNVLVTGDREWTDLAGISEALFFQALDHTDLRVIEGEARGADKLARRAAELLRVPVAPYPADWERYGKAAGVLRNQQMLDEEHPDLVLAFHDHLGSSRGTRDMVRRALKADIPVILYGHRGYSAHFSDGRTHVRLTARVIVEGTNTTTTQPSKEERRMAMWRSTAAQTANNDASAVIGHAVAAGVLKVGTEKEREKTFEVFDAIRDHVMENLEQFLTQDDEAFEERNETKGSKKGSKSGGKSGRKGKTGGGRKGGKGKKPSLDDALELELNFGAFEGETLGTVLELSAEEADDEYSYGDGERDGRDYIAWLASDRNKNDFVRNFAQVIADEEGIDYED